MKGIDGKVKVAGFYDNASDLTVEDRAAIARVPFDEAQYISDLGIPGVLAKTVIVLANACGRGPHLN